MSNDSNERGHDTAAAFQVGDRVQSIFNPMDEHGVVVEPDEPGYVLVEMAADSLAPGARIYYRPEQLTLISRAPEPASAPVQTAIRPGDLVKFNAFNGILKGEVDAIHNDEAAVMVPAWDGYTALYVPLAQLTLLQRPAPTNPRIICEPATPAPAATPPALDTHDLRGLALPIREHCPRCLWAMGNGDCPDCQGDGYIERTIRLTDDALDRLVAALAPVLAPVLVKHMAHDIRMIANDRP